MSEEDFMEFDVVIVGAGPAGLSCGIRLKQKAQEDGKDINVCILEKGSEVGAHLLSGAVLEPRSFEELFPDWKEKGAPLRVPVTKDKFMYMTQGKAIPMPTPPQMHNKGNYIISLGEVAKWMAEQAESLGVEIFPGYPASEILYDGDQVIGVKTGDMGIDENGEKTDHYQPGVKILAKQTVFAEGCRGSLTKELFQRFDLRSDCDPQTYGLGIKEVWEIDPSKHQEGLTVHTIGWPMDSKTYGGSWIYHWDKNRVSIGFVVGLDYKNPYLSPFEEMQRFKTHPYVKNLLEGGKRLSYGGRALSEGGFQSIPKLVAPGALIIGDSAGFLNVPKIKGNHTAMKSGAVAAEALFEHLQGSEAISACGLYPKKLKSSWLWKELYKVRNIRPSFHKGLWAGVAYSAFDTYILRGHAPWTFSNHADHDQLLKKENAKPIDYPKPDGELTFDRLSSVFLTNTNHAENQPCHLTLKDDSIPVPVNLEQYAGPEARYCPAAVYEYVEEGGQQKLQINAQNCIHCKTCDIKDPKQNINWITPEGGGGPNYTSM